MQPEDRLQQYLQQGILGIPEIRKDEKQQFLGQFRERVLKIMLQGQMADDRYIDGMINALDDPRVHRLYIRTQEQRQGMRDFSALTVAAQDKGVPFSFVDGATYQGDIAAVLVAEDAVDEADIDITVSDLPLEFYQHQGKTICQDCYQKVEKNYPTYQKNFKKVGIWKKLLGYSCPIASEHK